MVSKGTIWALFPLELDPPYELKAWDICQLVPGTKDGFPEDGVQISCNSGPDPPHCDYSDPPHSDEYIDPPHRDD